MLLSDMLQGVELSAPPLDPSLARRDAAGIAADSQEELRDRLFVCLKGRQADGHSFAAQAEAAGAAAVLCQQDVGCRRQILTPRHPKRLRPDLRQLLRQSRPGAEPCRRYRHQRENLRGHHGPAAAHRGRRTGGTVFYHPVGLPPPGWEPPAGGAAPHHPGSQGSSPASAGDG